MKYVSNPVAGMRMPRVSKCKKSTTQFFKNGRAKCEKRAGSRRLRGSCKYGLSTTKMRKDGSFRCARGKYSRKKKG